MSKKKSASEAARKAWVTRRQRDAWRKPLTESSKKKILEDAYRKSSSAINRALKNGIPVDREWMLEAPQRIMEQDFRCAITGIESNVDYKTKGAGGTHLAPSPDQIVAGKGYVPGNVRWVLWAVNRAKGEMPEELFYKICKGVVEQHYLKD
jgi:hypothetical protein